MRVLALTNLYPNPFQPRLAPFNRQQFRALSLQHQVRVIAPVAWTREWNARRSSSVRLPVNRQRLCDGITVDHPRYTFTPKILRGWYGRFFLHSARGCFQRAASEFRPDVVLGCWAYPDGWAAVRLAREFGLPAAIMVHGSDVLTVREAARLRPTIDALTQADAVIAVSRDLAEQVTSMGITRSRVHVVYNGVNRQLFCPGPRDQARAARGLPRDEMILLFIGNLVPVKGLDILIAACARLLHAGLRFRCLLIGEGPLRKQLQNEISRRGLQEHVQLLGAKPLEELPLWYRSADLFVLPSRSEGVPNVLLECMACGTPFVATRVGGIPEIAHEQSLVAPGDAGALADKIRASLAATPGVRSIFRPASWSDSARALADVLRSLIAGPTEKCALAG